MADQEEEGLDVFSSVNGPSASGICCSRFFSNTSPAICEMDVKGLTGWAVSKRPLVHAASSPRSGTRTAVLYLAPGEKEKLKISAPRGLVTHGGHEMQMLCFMRETVNFTTATLGYLLDAKLLEESATISRPSTTPPWMSLGVFCEIIKKLSWAASVPSELPAPNNGVRDLPAPV